MPSEEDLIAERKRKREEFLKQGINPYPYSFNKTNSAADLQNKYKKLPLGESVKDKVSIAGRIISLRKMGKATFAHVLDETGKIQV